MTMGRPTLYSDELADDICDRLASGESLREMCASAAMPDESTIYRWLRSHDDFCEKYTRAREFQAEPFLEDCLAIADEPATTAVEVSDKNVRIQTRQWAMGRLASKKYGNKVANEHSGPSGGPIETTSTLNTGALTLEQLRALASIPVQPS